MSKGVDYYFNERYPLRLEDLHKEITVIALSDKDDDAFAEAIRKLVDHFCQNTKLHLAAYQHTMDDGDMKHAEKCSATYIVDWLKKRRS